MLEQFAAELRTALADEDAAAAKQRACDVVARYCVSTEFVDAHLPTRSPGEPIREVLYEDPDQGFCICGHVFHEGQNAAPHDHGPSWAIYGQVSGQTVMTDWAVVDAGSRDQPKKVSRRGTYTLNPGDVHLYDVGAVHSLVRSTPVKTIRIEGQNLDHVRRSHIEPVDE